MIHLLKEKDGRRTLTKCGLIVLPKVKSTVKITIWEGDVDCPLCKPGEQMYLVIEHKVK